MPRIPLPFLEKKCQHPNHGNLSYLDLSQLYPEGIPITSDVYDSFSQMDIEWGCANLLSEDNIDKFVMKLLKDSYEGMRQRHVSRNTLLAHLGNYPHLYAADPMILGVAVLSMKGSYKRALMEEFLSSQFDQKTYKRYVLMLFRSNFSA